MDVIILKLVKERRSVVWLLVAVLCVLIVGVLIEFQHVSVSRYPVPGNTVTVPILGFDTPDNSKHISDMCQETFNDTLEDNIRVIENYPQGTANEFLWKIGGNKTHPDKITSFPVIVTAIDKDYYPFSQGMFLTLHEVLMKQYNNTVRVIVYDIGMTRRQLKMLHNKCRCELRRFPFEEFPQHVRNLKTYAFKPIIIQKVLMEVGFVWWVDISVKFTKFNVDTEIKYVTKNGILFFVSTDDRFEASVARHTDVRTFQFLGEDICKFRPYGETWATTVLFHFNRMSQVLVRAWASCALNENCIAPPGTQDKLACDLNINTDGQCHRFDQSVLSILTRRISHNRNIYPIDETFRKIFFIYRREFVDYFERCRYQFTCY